MYEFLFFLTFLCTSFCPVAHFYVGVLFLQITSILQKIGIISRNGNLGVIGIHKWERNTGLNEKTTV